METKYAGADWIKSAFKITDMSSLGEDVADLLGELFFGIYHLSNSNLKKVMWGEQSNIDVVLGWHSFATYDYDELTRLVFLAHHRAIRVEIHPHSFKYFRLTFSRRSKRTGVLYLRHPSLDAAVAKFKETVSLPEVQLEDCPMDKIGIELIAAERQRQVTIGWDADHDDAQNGGSLALAAACYAMHATWQQDGIPLIWPWDDKCWKPKDQLSDLIRAGALIAAEIDRLQRVAEAAMED